MIAVPFPAEAKLFDITSCQVVEVHTAASYPQSEYPGFLLHGRSAKADHSPPKSIEVWNAAGGTTLAPRYFTRPLVTLMRCDE
jgi:hypothetical protein